MRNSSEPNNTWNWKKGRPLRFNRLKNGKKRSSPWCFGGVGRWRIIDRGRSVRGSRVVSWSLGCVIGRGRIIPANTKTARLNNAEIYVKIIGYSRWCLGRVIARLSVVAWSGVGGSVVRSRRRISFSIIIWRSYRGVVSWCHVIAGFGGVIARCCVSSGRVRSSRGVVGLRYVVARSRIIPAKKCYWNKVDLKNLAMSYWGASVA